VPIVASHLKAMETKIENFAPEAAISIIDSTRHEINLKISKYITD